MNIIYYKLILTSVEDLFHKLCLENFKSFSDVSMTNNDSKSDNRQE